MISLTMLGIVLMGLSGIVALVHWYRAKLPFLQQMGLDIHQGVFTELFIGLGIGSLVLGGIFGVEWALGLIRVQGLVGNLAGLRVGLIDFSLGAVGEELFERGLMLNGLRALLRSRWLAVLPMAVVVALLHSGQPHTSILSLIGAAMGATMFAIAYLGTKRLWMPIGLHFAWDFFEGPVLGFPTSGQLYGGLVQQVAVGPMLLRGGSYGPEAGLIGIGFRFLLVALVLGATAMIIALSRISAVICTSPSPYTDALATRL
jgi:membrane protease YdiL (CAAX protease family)